MPGLRFSAVFILPGRTTASPYYDLLSVLTSLLLRGVNKSNNSVNNDPATGYNKKGSE